MRRKRPLERKESVVRDATLVVIASEDRYAVSQYFDFFRSTRIQFHVLETDHGQSSPAHVMRRLDDFMKKYDFGEGDEFWLVSDTDHWIRPGHIQNLVEVVKLCRQKGIKVALSNPCFDLWLLLHFAEFPDENPLTCREVGERLRAAVGHYNKSKVFNLPITDLLVRDAIRRSKAKEPRPDDIPNDVCTSVHRIIEDLVSRNVISIPL